MVKAATKVIPVLVDCDWGRKNKDVSKKYGVRGYPTVIFTDPKGEVISKLKNRSAAGVAGQIAEVAKKYKMKAAGAPALEPVALPFGKDVKKALEEGEAQKKPVILFFDDGSEDAIATSHLLLDKTVTQTLDGFVVAQVAMTKDCPICKAYKARRGSVIKVVDPMAETPSAKPVASIQGKNSVKALVTSLDRAAKKWKKAQSKD